MRKELAEGFSVSQDAAFPDRVAALDGLTLGMTRPGSLTNKQLSYLERVGGIDINIVAIGGPPNLLSALSQESIDGFAISVPVNRIAVQRGEGMVWIDNARGDDPNIDPFVMESLLTTRAFAENHPEEVTALIRATQRAVNRIATDSPREIREVVRSEFGKYDPEVMLLGIEAVQPALNRTGRITREMARNTIKLDGTQEVTADQLFETFTDRYLP